MVEVIRVTDDTSRDFLADLISEANRAAKRAPRVIETFTTDPLTAWSDMHADIDALLTDWEGGGT